MQTPLRITFRDISPSEAVEAAIRTEMTALERYFDRITGCHVTVAEPHKHHHQGNLYSVRIDLNVPGEELVINREHLQNHAHEDAYLAVREAFHAARRVLEDYVRRIRGDVKTHSLPSNGTIAQLVPEDRYGFIVSNDGREFYFDQNNLADTPFTALEVGEPVHFVEATGERGGIATAVRLLNQRA